MGNRDLLHWYFNPWVAGGAILLALVLLAITVGLIWFTRPGPSPAGQATAVLQVIPAATATPLPPTPAPTANPNTPTPPLPPGVIGVGARVQIFGTGGDGLRLRINPGLQGQVRFLGAEAEEFIVREGPQTVDNFIWWYLADPTDETRQGWAVADYLKAVSNP